jgi:hypothetical protein
MIGGWARGVRGPGGVGGEEQRLPDSAHASGFEAKDVEVTAAPGEIVVHAKAERETLKTTGEG